MKLKFLPSFAKLCFVAIVAFTHSYSYASNFDATVSSDNKLLEFVALDSDGNETRIDLTQLTNAATWWKVTDLNQSFDASKDWTFTFYTENFSGNGANPAGFIAELDFGGASYNTGFADWKVRRPGGTFENATLNSYNYNGNNSWTNNGASDISNALWIGSNTDQQVSDEAGMYAYSISTAAIAPVPEASTYLMMLSGLGFIGVVLRRKKRQLQVK